MPWKVAEGVEGCEGFAVVKEADGSLVGCHMTKEAADSQVAALYATDGDQAGGTAMSESAEVDKNGSVVDVLLIAPGTSKNRRRYPADVLKAAVPLFEGARAFAASGPDHNDHERGVKSLVGWYSNARWVEGQDHPTRKGAKISGVAAEFNISESAPWLRSLVSDAIKRGKPDLVGFSIVGEGETAVVRESSSKRPIIEVRRINAIESVDVVVNPAAGGTPLRLVASKESQVVDFAALTLASATAALAKGEILPDELKEKRPDLHDAIVNGAAQPSETVSPEAEAPAAGVPAAEVVAPEAVIAAEVAATAAVAEARLAALTVPEVVKARVRTAVAGKKLTEAEVNKVIKEEADYAASVAKPEITDAGAARVTGMVSEKERVTEGLYGTLVGKNHDSLKGWYVGLTGDSSMTGRVQESSRLTEALDSTSFAEILGDSIRRALLDYYTQPGLDQWKKIATTVPLRDFRTNRRQRFGGYGNLSPVSEGAAYGALTSPTDEEATYAPIKRGGTETVTMEMIANDDLGALRDIPKRLGRAAAQTLHEFVFNLLKDNSAVYDSVALFHASHNNLGTTALSASSLKDLRLKMLKQADLDNSKRLGITPRYLVLPVDLEHDAFTILNSIVIPSGAGVAAPSDANYVKTYGLEVISVPYWTDANNWFLVASPSDVPTIEVGFVNGEQPELFVADQPTVGSMFTNDKIVYKIRHIYGAAVLDYRGFAGAIVA